MRPRCQSLPNADPLVPSPFGDTFGGTGRSWMQKLEVVQESLYVESPTLNLCGGTVVSTWTER
jgi:hypothetical protein